MTEPTPGQGRTVVVTGGARGIGHAVMRRLLADGGRGVVLDLGDPEEALPGVRYLRADVSDRASVADAFGSIGEVEGRVDVLVNNAGIQRVGLVDELDPTLWDAVVGTHLDGMFHCSAAAVPSMRRQGSGAIVTIASVAALVGLPGRGAYSASKAGMLGLTRVLAVELAEIGVRVNAVAPGFTRTGLTEQALRDGSLREDWIALQVPMKRMATPDEVAGAVAFLSGPDATYITGQCLVVDGGWSIQGITARPEWLGG